MRPIIRRQGALIFGFLTWLAVLGAGTKAPAQQFIPLWPSGQVPGVTRPVSDSIVNHRYYQVGKPGMIVFHPMTERNTHGAVLICPGGGYTHLAYQTGGIDRAKWFNLMGFTACVLIYRLPNQRNLTDRAAAPLQDAQRAMRIIHRNAKAWGIDPARIGVVGSSAGGHLAAWLSTDTLGVPAPADSLTRYSFRPNFTILVSPVITMGRYAHRGSRRSLLGPGPSQADLEKCSPELHVSASTPPCFIADAFNDHTVDPHNSLLYYKALLDHHVPASLHVFPQGGHSIGMRNNPGSTKYWPDLCESWLQEMGFLKYSSH